MNGDFWGIADADALVAAIDKELDTMARQNAELVRKGRLTERERDYVVGLLRDIRSDLAHTFGPLEPGQDCERRGAVVRWRDKVRWIRNEDQRRREEFPELVRKGRLTELEAKTGIRLIAVLRRMYWTQLFMWEPEPGAAADYLAERRAAVDRRDAEALERLHGSAGAKVFRELVRRHMAATELEDNPQQSLVA